MTTESVIPHSAAQNEDTSPEVSVVISAYNNANEIRQCLDQLLKQTLADFEAIVVNDGSTDATGEILAEYAAKDSRFVIIDQENCGLTLSLIRGCELARGRYIARHDADDFSDPERLEKQRDFLIQHPEVGFVSCQARYLGPNDEPLELMSRPTDCDEAVELMINGRTGPPAHGSVMFRKSLYDEVRGYRAEFYFSQDSDLWLRLVQKSKIAYCPEVLYFPRRDPNTITAHSRAEQKQLGEIARALYECRSRGESEDSLLQQARTLTEQVIADKQTKKKAASGAGMAYLIGSQLASAGDVRARSYLWQAIQSNPLHWKAWYRLLQTTAPLRWRQKGSHSQ